MPLTRRPNIQQEKFSIRYLGEGGLREALKSVQRRHQRIVQPWNEPSDVPDFTIEVKKESGKMIGLVKMSGSAAESAGITVWQLLDRGTNVRFMQLSHDWQSKTQPGRLSSGAGAGRKLGLDFEDAKPGIEARDFSGGVADAAKDEVGIDIEFGYKKGFTRAFWRGAGA